MTSWHVKGFWVPPAHCSTDRAGFVYIVSPGRRPASFKPTIRLKEPLRRRKEGRRRLTSGGALGPGPGQRSDRLEAQRTGGGASGQPSFHPSYRGLNIRSARGTEEGGKAGARRPRSGGDWLPAQARALRRRNAGPDAGFERRASFLPSPAAPQTPLGRAAASTAPTRARHGAATPRRQPPGTRPLGMSPPVPLRPSAPEPPGPPTWIRFLCRLRSAMLAAPPGSF